MSDESDRLLRRMERERAARKQAERLLEEKSLELFNANQALQASTASLEKQVQDRTLELTEALQDGKLREAAKNPLLTEEARLTRRNEAEEKLTELQEFQLRARRTQETKLKQMREQVMKSRQGIVDELMAALEQFAQAGDYDLVLDRSGMTMNAIPLVAYSKPELDVTEKLIAFLQAKATTE